MSRDRIPSAGRWSTGDIAHNLSDGISMAAAILECSLTVGWTAMTAIMMHETPHEVGKLDDGPRPRGHVGEAGEFCSISSPLLEVLLSLSTCRVCVCVCGGRSRGAHEVSQKSKLFLLQSRRVCFSAFYTTSMDLLSLHDPKNGAHDQSEPPVHTVQFFVLHITNGSRDGAKLTPSL